MRARSRETASASKLEQCGPAESEREEEQREQRMTAPAPPWPRVEATEQLGVVVITGIS